jgi:hypothetical protein
MTNKNTKVRPYTDEQLLNRVKSLPTFKSLPDGYWILGVRSNEDAPNTYDDKFYLFYNDAFVDVITGTTNAGGDILRGGFLRYNKVGAFILKSDMWYHDVWKYVYRSSRGHELIQVNPVVGYRDGNKNDKSEEIGDKITGLFGINFHTNTFKWYNNVIKWTIGSWSAGCQVTNQRDVFLEWLMKFKDRQRSGKQKYITYCLINEFVPENG